MFTSAMRWHYIHLKAVASPQAVQLFQACANISTKSLLLNPILNHFKLSINVKLQLDTVLSAVLSIAPICIWRSNIVVESTPFLTHSFISECNEMIPCFLLAEPSTAEGSFHGGAGRRFQETPSRLPLHRPAALHQAEETGCRVSLGQRAAGD